MKFLDKARDVAYRLLSNPTIRRVYLSVPGLSKIFGKPFRSHPFDKIYDVDTSGFVSERIIDPGQGPVLQINPYFGSQPSLTRAALSLLPDVQTYSFVDIGSGKGRVLIIASETPFKEIIGLELSADLAKIAQNNIDKLTHKFPGRPPIRVAAGDALANLPLTGKIVFYFYHSFRLELFVKLVTKLERALSADLEHVFFIYHNPVWGEVMDASSAFVRWSAETIAFDSSELKTSFDPDDSFVIWQSVRGLRAGARDGANRKIVITTKDWRAELEPQSKSI